MTESLLKESLANSLKQGTKIKVWLVQMKTDGTACQRSAYVEDWHVFCFFFRPAIQNRTIQKKGVFG